MQRSIFPCLLGALTLAACGLELRGGGELLPASLDAAVDVGVSPPRPDAGDKGDASGPQDASSESLPGTTDAEATDSGLGCAPFSDRDFRSQGNWQLFGNAKLVTTTVASDAQLTEDKQNHAGSVFWGTQSSSGTKGFDLQLTFAIRGTRTAADHGNGLGAVWVQAPGDTKKLGATNPGVGACGGEFAGKLGYAVSFHTTETSPTISLVAVADCQAVRSGEVKSTTGVDITDKANHNLHVRLEPKGAKSELSVWLDAKPIWNAIDVAELPSSDLYFGATATTSTGKQTDLHASASASPSNVSDSSA
jgi:hypothetical protein